MPLHPEQAIGTKRRHIHKILEQVCYDGALLKYGRNEMRHLCYFNRALPSATFPVGLADE